jgi:hypothetical protein
MVSFPGPLRLSTEPSQLLAHEGPGCDAGDSSHSEPLADVSILNIIQKYNIL